jgi:NTE family protein
MGALVGGLYAAGMGADDLYDVISDMDWEEAFEDSIERRDLPQRRKSDDYDYASKVQFAFRNGALSIPLGLVQGQQTRLIIKQLMVSADDVDNFDDLPIPYRAVATDIETGKAYVFREGDVVTAMRASMSLPALLAPVEHDGRLLVDGGLAMNIPVEVGHEMGVDRLIVVDIGTPLRSRDEINNLLSVTDQMLGFLTRRNSEQSLANMDARDILINPELTGFGMLSFDQAQAIYERGYQAAVAATHQLAQLRVDDRTWEAYLADRMPQPASNPPIDYIAIKNDSSVSDDLIRARISQAVGEPLDRDRLLGDIAAVYALDYWETIDYEQTRDAGDNGLVIHARAKRWGEDKIKIGLNLVTDLEGSSDINIGGSYLLKGVNELGGEFYAIGQVGDRMLLGAEFYQPLDVYSRYFVAPRLDFRDDEVLTLGPEFDQQREIGQWRVRRIRMDLAGGANLFDNSQFRLGLFGAYGEYEADAIAIGDIPEDTFTEAGALVSYRYDNLDNPFFPTEGGFLYADYEAISETLGADNDFQRWRAVAQGAYSFGRDKRNTVILTARTGQSEDATKEPQNFYQLGGLFNLSGLSQDFFSGRNMAFAMAQYQRRLSERSVIPLDLPVYLGGSIEGGQLWSDRSDIDVDDFIAAGSIYLAIDSPIGPLYVAYGRSEGDRDALYLSLGWPFLSNTRTAGR